MEVSIIVWAFWRECNRARQTNRLFRDSSQKIPFGARFSSRCVSARRRKRRLIKIFEGSRAVSSPSRRTTSQRWLRPSRRLPEQRRKNEEAPPLLRRRATGRRRLRSASRAQADLPFLSPILKANAPEPAPRITSWIRFSQLRRDSLFPRREAPRPGPA